MQRLTRLVLWLALLGVSFAQQTNLSPVPDTRPDAAVSQPAEQADTPKPTASASTAEVLGGINSYLGLRVHEIRFRGLSSEDQKVRGQLHDLLAQKEAEPLDRSKVRRSIQALYATGRFSDLQVEAQKTPQNEITLVFVARENYFVGSVSVVGQPKRPRANQLVNATKLQLGELYAHDKVELGIRNMKAVLADNGYYKAEITDEETYHSDTQQVDIAFHVMPDGRAHIGSVSVEGTPGYDPKRVLKIADLEPGHTVTADRATKALTKLRKKYQKQDRLEAQVAIVDRKYEPNSNTLDYVLRINRGPTVDIVVEGARVSQGKLRKYVPVYEEGAVDDDLLNEGLRNLRDYFQTRGYFDARVSWQKHFLADENRMQVVYVVELGVRHKLVAVAIEGNRYFSTDLIRERMTIRPAQALVSQGIYSESLLARDMAAIQALYKTNGFEHVTIAREVDDDYDHVKGHIRVVLRINEGPQRRVASVNINGNRTFDDATLEAMMSTIPGQPFSDASVATDRESILNFYFNSGFPDVQFESRATPIAGDPTRMDVRITINEGDRVYVDRILVAGLKYTRPYVVRRELQVQEGQPLSQLGMLKTQQRLYDLGIFNEVDMAVQNPEGESKYKNLLFQMREAKRWTFNYGFGIEIQTGQPADITQINTAPAPGISVPPNTTPPQGALANPGENPQGGTGVSPRISFEVTRINFRGRDHTLSFKSHLSSITKRALVTYDAPHFWDRDNFRMTFTGWYDNSRDVRTFTSERLEGSAQLEWVATRISTLLWRYNYRRVKVDPRSLAISPPLVPLLSKPVRLGLPSFTYIRDKRNDPLETTKGNYTTLDFGVSSKWFGSGQVQGTAQQIQLGDVNTSTSTTATAANFLRGLTQNSTYSPLRGGVVIARTTKIGIEDPFGRNASTLAIPLPERFFAGGAQLHRGFALNQAGPRDLFTGFPVGGNALFVNSVEAHFPPPTLPWAGQNLSFVLFHDAGNVFLNATDMAHSLTRWYQPHAGDCNRESTRQLCRFDYMEHAAGVGVRYRTPIGPVRVDFSYAFNPSRFPYYVQCPTTATNKGACATQPPGQLLFQNNGALKHFNFFFSVGQSF